MLLNIIANLFLLWGMIANLSIPFGCPVLRIHKNGPRLDLWLMFLTDMFLIWALVVLVPKTWHIFTN